VLKIRAVCVIYTKLPKYKKPNSPKIRQILSPCPLSAYQVLPSLALRFPLTLIALKMVENFIIIIIIAD
jgi:hypothetical protein